MTPLSRRLPSSPCADFSELARDRRHFFLSRLGRNLKGWFEDYSLPSAVLPHHRVAASAPKPGSSGPRRRSCTTAVANRAWTEFSAIGVAGFREPVSHCWNCSLCSLGLIPRQVAWTAVMTVKCDLETVGKAPFRFLVLLCRSSRGISVVPSALSRVPKPGGGGLLLPLALGRI